MVRGVVRRASKMCKDDGKAACAEPFSAPLCGHVSCPEVPSEEYQARNNPSALSEERPCGEPPIEVAIESEEATPKVRHNHGDNDDWDWDLLRSKAKKEKKKKRLAQNQAPSTVRPVCSHTHHLHIRCKARQASKIRVKV
jgi:hypothetical protein